MTPDRPWYATRFDRTYLQLYAHRDAGEARLVTRHLLQPLGLEGRRVLDLGCGAGRYALAVRRCGARPVGVDLSADLLRAARAAAGGEPLELVHADMRRLPFTAGAFDLVLSMFTSFGYFATLAEDQSALREMARVLRPAGSLVLDYLNTARVRLEAGTETERTVGRFTVREVRRLDPTGERIVKEIELRAGDLQRTYREEVRLWTASALGAELAAAGLEVDSQWGDYAGNAYRDATSPRLVLHARRRSPA